jgi:hypothetical protein
MINFWFEPAERFIIEWNGSATFNVYQMVNTNQKAIDCFTVYDVETIDEAYKHAEQWIERYRFGE